MTSLSLGSVGCPLWACPLVELKSSSEVVDQDMDPRGGVSSLRTLGPLWPLGKLPELWALVWSPRDDLFFNVKKM